MNHDCNGEKYQGKVKTHNEHLHHVKFRTIKKVGHKCAHHCHKRQNIDKEIYRGRHTYTLFLPISHITRGKHCNEIKTHNKEIYNQ